MNIFNCPNCGGTHYGSVKCPYINEPCVVCGDGTILACSDCAIDYHRSVHVCKKPECRDAHESAVHPQTLLGSEARMATEIFTNYPLPPRLFTTRGFFGIIVQVAA